MNVPANLKYSNTTSVPYRGYNGITASRKASWETSIRRCVPTVGENARRRQVFGSIEAVKP